MNIPVTLVRSDAKLPNQARRHDAGYDLFSLEENIKISPGERVLIKTGITMAIPNGYYGRIAPRSGLALKHGIDVMGGVIDSQYRGEIGVILLNISGFEFNVNQGDKIAQIIIEKCYDANFIKVSQLDETERGVGGFGHSGK